MIPAAAFGAAAAPHRRPALHPATRLGALVLALVAVFTAPWPVVAALAVALSALLAATGLGPGGQWRQARPWLPMAALALAVHTFTTTDAAPLWHPSWAGLAAGLRALTRLAASLAAFAAYLRSGSLDDLVAGLAWWLRPLRRLGLPVDELGLAVAVACGTVPQVIGEGRRLQAVDEMRRHGPRPAGAKRRRPGWGWLDRARLVVPLLETLARRAETLELALRGRRPVLRGPGRPRAREWAWLGTGLVATVGCVLLRKGG